MRHSLFHALFSFNSVNNARSFIVSSCHFALPAKLHNMVKFVPSFNSAILQSMLWYFCIVVHMGVPPTHMRLEHRCNWIISMPEEHSEARVEWWGNYGSLLNRIVIGKIEPRGHSFSACNTNITITIGLNRLWFDKYGQEVILFQPRDKCKTNILDSDQTMKLNQVQNPSFSTKCKIKY